MSKEIKYTISLDAEIKSLEGKLNSVKGTLGKLTQGGNHPEILKLFETIEGAIDKLRTKASQPINTTAGFNSLLKETAGLETQFEKLLGVLEKVKSSADGDLLTLLPPDEAKKINDTVAALYKYTTAIEKATQETTELVAARKEQSRIESDIAKQEKKKRVATGGAEETRTKLEGVQQLREQSQERLKILKAEEEEASRRIEEIEQIYKKMPAGTKIDKRKKVRLSDGTETTLGAEKKKKNAATIGIESESENFKTLSVQVGELEGILKKFNNQILTADGNLAGLTTELKTCRAQIEELEKNFKSQSAADQAKAYQELRAAAQSLGVDISDIPLEATAENVEALTKRLNNLVDEGFKNASGELERAGRVISSYGEETDLVRDKVEEATEAEKRYREELANREAIKNKIKDFIGMAGAVKFFRDAVQNAFATVKELDKVMTEMAVVTELDVGDYWSQMPEYTQRANELGVSIKAAYESATLFYQQGLKTNEVVALSNETLKMARIAGLDAAEATDRMTAALRGFNMELNETSAQKVADVYSQLAAVTASDVDEISTAMTKTASIASNAGMEFETTAAFLSQIIETTRESAETAGTAMKTVIARFQELKKDPAEIGEVDGEIVDANKIETALRTVGVSLRDAQGQFRDLDDVFLELASKWDGLDTNTQRYIATIAAGSRQQSRFIAMMSDYSRTQELVGEAQDSAGASSKQYEKTLDSLETKLTQLENAWNEFTTGIMNSDLVKGAITFLTKVLNALNKVTSGFGKFGGMISKIGTAIAIFKVAEVIIKKFGDKVIDKLHAAGRALGLGMKESLGESKEVLGKVKKEADSVNKKSTKKKVFNPVITREGSGDSNGANSTPQPASVFRYGQSNEVFSPKKKKANLETDIAAITEDIENILGKTEKPISELLTEFRETKKAIADLEAEIETAKNENNTDKVTELTNKKAELESQFNGTFGGDVAPKFEQLDQMTSELELMTPDKAQIIGRTIGGVIAGPLGVVIGDKVARATEEGFAEIKPIFEESKELSTEGMALRAAAEFGDGTGSGAERQYQVVDDISTSAEVGADMRDTFGKWHKGDRLNSGALGLETEDSDIKAQFFESGGFTGANYNDFEKKRQEAGEGPFDATKAATEVLGPDATSDDIARFQELVARWNTIVEESVNDFQTANQTLDAVNEGMKKNAEELNAAAEGGKTGVGADKVKKGKSMTRLKFRSEDGETDPSKFKNKGKKQKKKGPDAKAKKKAAQEEKKTEKKKKKAAEQEEKLAQTQQKHHEKTEENLKKQQASYEKLTSSIGNVGTTLSMVGAGAGMLGGLFESMGLSGVAEQFNNLGSVMSIVGGAISMVSTVMGVMNGIMAISSAVTMIQAGATTAETAAEYGHVTALIAKAAAALAAATGMSPMLAITIILAVAIIALVAVVLILVAAFNAIKNATPEAKLESAQAAADAAGEAADRAAESYENLKSSLEGLDDQYEALENMTRGTREWNDAVTEINNSVLDLIEDYPELASLVQTENGVMKIDTDSEEVQDVLDKYSDKAQTAKAAEIGAKMDVVARQNDVNFKNLSADATYNKTTFGSVMAGVGAWLGGNLILPGTGAAEVAGVMASDKVAENAGRADTEKLARALATGAVVNENGELKVKDQSMVDELGLTTDVLKSYRGATEETIKELTNFGQALEEGDAKMDAMFMQMANTALQSVDMAEFSNKQQDQIQAVADDEWAEAIYNEQMEQVADVDMGSNSEEGKQLREEVAKNYGDDAKVDGNKIIYTDESGETQEVELTDDQFKTQYAAMKANEDMAKRLEDIPKAINKVSEAIGTIVASFGSDGMDSNSQKAMGEAVNKIFSDQDGKALTKADLDALTYKNSKGETKRLGEGATGKFGLDGFSVSGMHLQAMWMSLSDAEQKALGDYETFVKRIQDSQEKALAAFAKVEEYEKEIGVDINDKLTSDAAKGFAEQLDLVMRSSGTEAAQGVNTMLRGITDNLSPDQLETVYKTLNGMDWTKMEDWENLPTQLEALGVSIPKEQLDLFIDEAIEAANALQTVDLTEFSEKLKTLGQIIKDINSGELNRNFSEEQYQAIIEMDPELANQFSMNIDGSFDYMGTSIEKLTEAIQLNTEATLNNARKQLESKVVAADVINGAMSQVQTYTKSDGSEGEFQFDLTNKGTWSTSQKRMYLDYITQSLNSTGMDIGQLGIKGYSNETDLDKLEDSEINEILNQMMNIQNAAEANQKELTKTMRSTMAIKYKAESANQNTASLQAVRTKLVIDGVWNDDSMNEMMARMEAMSSAAVEAGVDESLVSRYNALYENLSELAPEENGVIDATYQSWLDQAGQLETHISAIAEAQKQAAEEAEKARTSYDYMVMSAEAVEAAMRQADKLDREMTRKQDRGTLTKADALSNIESQLGAYSSQATDIRGQQETIANTITDRLTNSEFGKYMAYDKATGQIVVDYNKVNEAYGNNPEMMESFETFKDGIFDLRDTYRDNEDTLLDIQESVDYLSETGKEEYGDLLSQIKEGLVSQRQEEIDKLTAIDESVQKANQSITNRIQEQINEERQARQNDKAMEQLNDKKERLALLKRDTSGGHTSEIAALEKEIGEDQQNIEDNLLDQSLKKLSDDNAKAAEQRQRQIEIQQAQLDIWAASPESWARATEILNQGLASDNWANTLMGEILKKTVGFDEMSSLEQETWLKEMKGNVALAGAWNDGLATETGSLRTVLTTAETNITGALDSGFGDDSSGVIGGLATGKESIDQVKNAILGDGTENILYDETIGMSKVAEETTKARATLEKLAEVEAVSEQRDKMLQVNSNDKLNGMMSKSTFNSIKNSGKDATQKKQQLGGYDSYEAYQHDWAEKRKTETLQGAKLTSEKFEDSKTEAGKEYNIAHYGFEDWNSYEKAYNAEHPNANGASGSIDAAKMSRAMSQPVSGYVPASISFEWEQTDSNGNPTGNWLLQAQVNGTTDNYVVASAGYVTDQNKSDALDTLYGSTSGLDPSNGSVMYIDEADKQLYGISGLIVRTKGMGNPKDGWHSIVDEYQNNGANKKDRQPIGRAEIDARDVWTVLRPVALETSAFAFRNSRKGTAGYYYETGGLADFTGPAWLDGTPSRPEYVLNAEQTGRFFELIDILKDTDLQQKENANGNNYYDIEINVEKIEDDYDVEQMAEKIKELIYEDSMYRNVNAIHQIR